MSRVWNWSRSGIRPLLLLGVVGLMIWPATMHSSYELRLFTLVGIYALLAMGYQFIFGHVGALALTQGTFFGVGAYAAAILTTRYGLDGSLGLAAAVVLPVLLAVLVAAPVLKLESHYFALATLGVGQVVLLVAIAWQSMTGGSNGLGGIPALQLLGREIGKGQAMLAAVWVFVALGALFSWRATRGLYGAALSIARENPIAALSIGIDTSSLRYATFLLSAAFAGMAGALYAHTIRVVSVEALEFPIMVACLTITVVGGRRHIAGAILGAILIVNLPEWFRGLDKYYLIAYGLALLLMVILAPDGLIGLIEQWRQRLWPEQTGSVITAQRPTNNQSLRATPRGAACSSAAPARPGGADAGAPLLELRDIHKRFGGVHALNGVSLQVRRGQIFGLIGPNGSGKTTALNIVTGIYRADVGRVLLAGADIGRVASHEIARRGVARTFQNINLVDDMRVVDNVAVARYGAERAGLLRAIGAPWRDPDWQSARATAMQLLDALGVADVSERPAGGLAYGLKRRVEIARALALEPSLLLLDEPAAGLNESEQLDLAQRLRAFANTGLSILVIEHNMPFLMPLAERIACFDQGRLIALGTPAEIRADPRVIEAYLGAPEPVAAA
ncbi:MAG: branched-chain amino acid ABC transporter ATP-binding protein/permease [Variovorax sp.]